MKKILFSVFLVQAGIVAAFDVKTNPLSGGIDSRYVEVAGDVMTGPLQTTTSTLTGAYFSVGTSTFVVKEGRVGIGTTALAAKNLNRNFIGCDSEAKYIKIAKQNIK